MLVLLCTLSLCYVWVDALELEDFIAPGVGGLLLVKVEGLGEGGRQGAVDLDAVLLAATSRAFFSRPSSGGGRPGRSDQRAGSRRCGAGGACGRR